MRLGQITGKAFANGGRFLADGSIHNGCQTPAMPLAGPYMPCKTRRPTPYLWGQGLAQLGSWVNSEITL